MGNFYVGNEKNILAAQKIECSNEPLIVAESYNENETITNVVSTLELPFNAVRNNEIAGKFTLIERPRVSSATDEELKETLNRIFLHIKERVVSSNYDVSVSLINKK